MELFLIVLALSAPVFYIMGVVDFIKRLRRRPQTVEDTRAQQLTRLIAELKTADSAKPGQTLSQQIALYEKELATLGVLVSSPVLPTDTIGQFAKTIPASASPPAKEAFQADVKNIWSNWYSENSINLLLYVGAFLIVTSASIFVGFQWESIPGTTKAFLISLFTLAWIGFGLWFYRIPKIKNAGATFSAIGALLVPLCGLAWYNFVFQSSVRFGAIWAVTSIISLLLYVFFVRIFRKVFYTYIANVATLSLAISIVHMFGLEGEYYILAGILTAFILLLTQSLLPAQTEEEKRLMIRPLEISSNILMPLSLLYGFMVGASENKLFTLEGTVSIALGTAYYFYSYVFSRKAEYLAVAKILFPLTVILLFKWLLLPSVALLLCLDLVAFLYLVFSYFWRTKRSSIEFESNLILSLTISILVFLSAGYFELSPVTRLFFSFIPVFIGTAITFIKGKADYNLGTAILMLSVAASLLVRDVLHIEEWQQVLGMVYLVAAIGSYINAVSLKKRQDYLTIFLLSCGLFFGLNMVLIFPYLGYFLLSTLALAATLLVASIQFEKKELLYFSNAVLFISLTTVLRLFHAAVDIYPLACTGLSFALYGVAKILPPAFGSYYRKTALAALIFVPFVFGWYGMMIGDSYSYRYPNLTQSAIQKNALLSAYASVFLLALDALFNQSSGLGYVASALGMIVYLWQVKYLGAPQIQWYTLPLGIYFLALSYLRKLKQDWGRRDAFDALGLFFIVVPTLFQAFGSDGFLFALFLGLYGIVLIVLGNSLRHKPYIFAGIFALAAAIISQTYEYVFSLPRWILTGAVGLAFLGIAISLLLRRKETPHAQ